MNLADVKPSFATMTVPPWPLHVPPITQMQLETLIQRMATGGWFHAVPLYPEELLSSLRTFSAVYQTYDNAPVQYATMPWGAGYHAFPDQALPPVPVTAGDDPAVVVQP